MVPRRAHASVSVARDNEIVVLYPRLVTSKAGLVLCFVHRHSIHESAEGPVNLVFIRIAHETGGRRLPQLENSAPLCSAAWR